MSIGGEPRFPSGASTSTWAEEASFKPGPKQWSLKANLAHFIHSERGFQHYLAELVDGFESYADDYGENVEAYIYATVKTYPTTKELVKQYKISMGETISFIANLPDEFVARKGSYWRIAYNLLQEPYHFESHLEQMRLTLESARKE